jgi:hypothetical protein
MLKAFSIDTTSCLQYTLADKKSPIKTQKFDTITNGFIVMKKYLNRDFSVLCHRFLVW